jgi:ADP-ribose pyrophosphatase
MSIRIPKLIGKNIAFSTPWFAVEEKTYDSSDLPYYALSLSDYVSVIAITREEQILLVKQYRPVVDEITLELPSGCVDEGETPLITAHRELIEETGYEAQEMELLAVVNPDVGRLGNKLWCYFATDVKQIYTQPQEDDIELVCCNSSELLMLIKEGKFNHALNLAVVLLGFQKGKLKWQDVFRKR